MAKIDLSILITCYNKEEFLDECIHSIFEQTVKPKEVVLVHDGCENPMAHAKAVTLIYPDNKGVVRARAEAFR
ncbi:MAG: glycosyltransferase, partial [Patescibacteria group bacterium]